jgi:hypothetical protein
MIDWRLVIFVGDGDERAIEAPELVRISFDHGAGRGFNA